MGLACQLHAQDPREIIRRSVELDHRNSELQRHYTFVERDLQRELDSDGKLKKETIRSFDVTMQEGSPYKRLVGRNDKPLSADDEKNEQKKLEFDIEQRRKEKPEQKARRIAEWNRKQERQREALRELPDAYQFHLVREEVWQGRPTWVIDGTPKPGYRTKQSSTSYLLKMKGRFWIDKADYQWTRVEVESTDTISFVGFVVRVAKGGRLVMEQQRINDEVWFPKRITVKAAARVLLVKGLNMEWDFTFSDYKKFQSESRVIDTGEMK